MNKLAYIIKNEYKTDILGKSFWISTILMPVLMIGFGLFIGTMSAESESLTKFSRYSAPDSSDWSVSQILAMMCGLMLVIFITMYGAMIFNKVKVEKCNRIVEIIATCVDGRTMMMAKIISVGLIGFTQLLIWTLIIVGIIVGAATAFQVSLPWHALLDYRMFSAIIWSVAFFVGGYVFYGSLFAAVGAMTDKNNENQEYVTIITLLLLSSFYIAQYAIDNNSVLLARICAYVPITSPSIGAVNAITNAVPLWQSLLTLAVLYAFAFLSVSIAGKIYRSTLLLKGTRFSLKDIITFVKSK